MTVDDRAGEALGHLQRAVLEMIQAARATLDLMEDVVADPQLLATIVASLGHLAQTVTATTTKPAPADDPEHRPGVERIKVV